MVDLALGYAETYKAFPNGLTCDSQTLVPP